VVATGVETIIDIVKSDADGTVREEGYQMPPPVEHATRTAGTTIAGIIQLFPQCWTVNPKCWLIPPEVDTVLASDTKILRNFAYTENFDD
jgi:hypothetical protein